MQITEDMIHRAAKELDRVALTERGWSKYQIDAVMHDSFPASEVSTEQAKLVLETALKTKTHE